MMKNWENNGTEEIGLVTPTPGDARHGVSVMTLSGTYHQNSNIRHTKSKNFNVSCLVLQLSLPNPLEPDVKLRMKM